MRVRACPDRNKRNMTETPKRKLAAIMFTDMVGYTALMQKDETKARELIQRHRDLMKPHVTKHGGKILQFVGDGTFCTFDSAIEAVNAALEIQHVFKTEDEMALRIGIHVGDVVVEGEEVYGDGVNVASRLEPLANAGGICVSDKVYDNLKNQQGIKITPLGEKELKNVEESLRVYSIEAAAENSAETPVSAEPKNKSRQKNTYIYAGMVILLAVLFLWLQPFFFSSDKPMEATGSIRSIAVLPLENLSNDPDQEYFSDGMTEALISKLAQIRSLKVISRTSVMQYKGVRKPLPEIAKELNVDAILEGSVMHAGGEVRITAQLIRASTDEHLWANDYTDKLENVLSLQSRIAKAIAKEIKITLTPQEKNRLESARIINPVALEAYLKGKFFWNKRTTKDIQTALEFYQQAVDADPNYALAYVGIAESYNLLHEYGGYPSSDTYPKAMAAANEALKLNPNLGEAHISLAYAYHEHLWDWKKAEEEFLKGLELNPNYPTGRQWYAEFLARQGRFEESLNQVRRSSELDPLALIIQTNLGYLEYASGNEDEGIKKLIAVSQLYPNNQVSSWQLSIIYRYAENKEEAYKYTMNYIRYSGKSTEFADSVEKGYRDAGLEGLNREYLKSLLKLEYVRKSDIIESYVFLGEYEKAIDWLEIAYEQKEVVMTYIDTILPYTDATLRSNPRFIALLKKMKFNY